MAACWLFFFVVCLEPLLPAGLYLRAGLVYSILIYGMRTEIRLEGRAVEARRIFFRDGWESVSDRGSAGGEN